MKSSPFESLDYIYVPAPDFDAAVRFYTATLGGEHRVSRRVKFVTENYLFRGGGLAMGGVRWHRENLSAEFGVSAPIGAKFVYVFPMVNVAYRFSVK